jgi:hypothetical protein
MSTRSLRLTLALSGLLAFGGAAYAQTPWQQHGRHDTVNTARQNERIREQRREHELRFARANELRRHDHDRRFERHSMTDRGRLTPHEQHVMNQRDRYGFGRP